MRPWRCSAGLPLPAGRARPGSSPAAGRRPSERGGRLGHPAPQPQRSLTGGTAGSQRAAGPGRRDWAGPAAAPRGARRCGRGRGRRRRSRSGRRPRRPPQKAELRAWGGVFEWREDWEDWGDWESAMAAPTWAGGRFPTLRFWTAVAVQDTAQTLSTDHIEVRAKLRHGVDALLGYMGTDQSPHTPQSFRAQPTRVQDAGEAPSCQW